MLVTAICTCPGDRSSSSYCLHMLSRMPLASMGLGDWFSFSPPGDRSSSSCTFSLEHHRLMWEWETDPFFPGACACPLKPIDFYGPRRRILFFLLPIHAQWSTIGPGERFHSSCTCSVEHHRLWWHWRLIAFPASCACPLKLIDFFGPSRPILFFLLLAHAQ